MRKAHEVAQAVAADPAHVTERGPKLASPHDAARLWAAMASIYGHRWTSAFGAEPDAVQLRVLSGIEWDAMKRGLSTLVDRRDPWPPSLVEFRGMCLGDDYDRTDGAAVAGRMPASRALPEPEHVRERRREVAREALATARRALVEGSTKAREREVQREAERADQRAADAAERDRLLAEARQAFADINEPGGEGDRNG